MDTASNVSASGVQALTTAGGLGLEVVDILIRFPREQHPTGKGF
jgi:hypothetical protein